MKAQNTQYFHTYSTQRRCSLVEFNKFINSAWDASDVLYDYQTTTLQFYNSYYILHVEDFPIDEFDFDFCVEIKQQSWTNIGSK